MFTKKPDPHDEAMLILKDQMSAPPQQVGHSIRNYKSGTYTFYIFLSPSKKKTNSVPRPNIDSTTLILQTEKEDLWPSVFDRYVSARLQA